MPLTLDPIRKSKVKQARSQGKSKAQSLREAGYSEATAGHHGHDIPVLKCVDQELMTEARKRDIIGKAWKVCEKTLASDTKQAPILAQALATKDMTEKIDQSVRNMADTTISDEELQAEIDAIRQRRLKGNIKV